MTGMPPATAASKLSKQAFGFGQRGEPDAVPGEQRLVGGDDMAAGFQRGDDRLQRLAALAADQLDEDVNVGGLGHFDRIVEPGDIAKVHAAVLRAVARRDGGDDEVAAALAGEHVAVVREDAQDGRADCAEAGYADFEGWVMRESYEIVRLFRSLGAAPHPPLRGTFSPQAAGRRG